MTDLLWFLGIVAIMAAAFVMRKRQNLNRALGRAAEQQADAARFGWQVEPDQNAMSEILRWRGTTDGMTWVAECLRTGRDRRAVDRSITKVTRWSTRRRTTVPVVIALLRRADTRTHDFSETGGLEVGANTLAGAILAKALGTAFEIRFGELASGVDAKSLAAVDAVAARYSNYMVLSTNADAATVLFGARLDAVLDGGGHLAQALDAQELSVLITPDGVAMSRAAWTASADALQPIVKAGAALTRAVGAR